MSGPLVDFKASEIAISGGFFDADVRRTVNRNMGQHVKRLTLLGEKTAKERLRQQNVGGTGYTENLIESYQKYDGGLYGKVRYKRDQKRPPGSVRYPADRRPYIVAAILETGRYAGRRVTAIRLTSRGARSRRRWQSGDRRTKAIFQMRYAARVVRAEARQVTERYVTRGL